MDVISILSIGTQVIPLLIQGIQFVESLFSGQKGKGALKKDFVMQFAEVAFASFGSQSDKEKWEEAKPRIANMIDEIVAIMNILK